MMGWCLTPPLAIFQLYRGDRDCDNSRNKLTDGTMMVIMIHTD